MLHRFMLFLPMLFALGCAKQDVWKDVPGGPVKVLVSFPPLYCFAKNVAGEDAKVYSMLTTQGPHDYQPTAQQAILAQSADVVFCNGLDLDDFVVKIANASGNRNLKVVSVGDAIPKELLLKMSAHEHGHGHAHEGHHHHHGEYDPHVWLGVPQAIKMVEAISASLQKVDSGNKDRYAERASKYIEELKQLENYGKDKLAGKMNRKFVTMHESLGYFGKTFDLDIVGSIQAQPSVEPDGPTIVRLTELCKKKDARVIAIEPQYRSGPAETLQKSLQREKLQVELVVIDPLETAESSELNADIYINVMKRNIDNLAKGLP